MELESKETVVVEYSQSRWSTGVVGSEVMIQNKVQR